MPQNNRPTLARRIDGLQNSAAFGNPQLRQMTQPPSGSSFPPHSGKAHASLPAGLLISSDFRAFFIGRGIWLLPSLIYLRTCDDLSQSRRAEVQPMPCRRMVEGQRIPLSRS